MVGCKELTKEPVYSKSTFTEEGINAVIEIPAGTNQKIEFNPATRQFEVDQKDGKDRIIEFLPYPGNYGFIPSTLMEEDEGGDGDAMDILVIGESQKTGTVLEVIPIACLDLRDDGEIDTKIIAVPADSALQVIKVNNFQDFAVKYSMAQTIIENWFLNYKGLGEMEFVAWRNEQVAMAEIRKWSKD